jgi:hypothetical protein
MLNWKMAPQHPDELRLGEQRLAENERTRCCRMYRSAANESLAKTEPRLGERGA